jgi:hypothetical protein
LFAEFLVTFLFKIVLARIRLLFVNMKNNFDFDSDLEAEMVVRERWLFI